MGRTHGARWCFSGGWRLGPFGTHGDPPSRLSPAGQRRKNEVMPVLTVDFLVCHRAGTEANRSVHEPQGTLARDLQSVWYLAIAITLPPWYALAAPIPLAVHKLCRTRRMLIYRRIFSHATIGLAYGLASVTFHSLPVSVVGTSPGTGRHALYWVLAVAACGMIGTFVNYGFILVAIRLSDPGTRLRDLGGSRESLTSHVLELG